MARPRNIQDDILKAILKAVKSQRSTVVKEAVQTLPPVPAPKSNSLFARGGRATGKRAENLEKLGASAAKRAKAENVANAKRAKFLREERRQVGRARRTVRSIEKSEEVASGRLPKKGGRRPTKNERREAADVAAQKAEAARARFGKYQSPKTVTQKIREGRGGKK